MSGDAHGYHSRNLVNGRSFMVIEWVVGIAVVSMLIGLALGYFLPLGNARKARVGELENALETAQQELADYKGEVFNQFATTAEKFRDLDQSYQALHQQLARSSVDLCGDAASPLLTAAVAPALAEGLSEPAVEDSRFSEEDLDAQTPDLGEMKASEEEASEIEQEIVVAEASAELETNIAADSVPTLTDRDADFSPDLEGETDAPAKRESA
ncbi:MAG: DUF1043 family protein [Pseudomonadales bacterium]|nr:DUF1043 family protein [Pseudomonadales bacterium]